MYFTREDKEYAVKFHAEFAGAVAKAVIEGERREIERGVRTVHVAAYTHRYGTDLSVFTTGREALRALGDIATSQCARDPVLRGSVIEAFGRWPAQGMNEDELAALCDAWPRFTNGEQLWVSECPLEFEAARRRDRAFMRPPEGDPEFNEEVVCETHGAGVPELDEQAHEGFVRDHDNHLTHAMTTPPTMHGSMHQDGASKSAMDPGV